MEPSASIVIVRPFLGFWLAHHGLSRGGFLFLLQLPWSCLPTAVGGTGGRHHKERSSPNQGVYPLGGLPTMPEGVRTVLSGSRMDSSPGLGGVGLGLPAKKVCV